MLVAAGAEGDSAAAALEAQQGPDMGCGGSAASTAKEEEENPAVWLRACAAFSTEVSGNLWSRPSNSELSSSSSPPWPATGSGASPAEEAEEEEAIALRWPTEQGSVMGCDAGAVEE